MESFVNVRKKSRLSEEDQQASRSRSSQTHLDADDASSVWIGWLRRLGADWRALSRA